MAEVEGKLVFCEVCGQSVFLKCVGEEWADGGYTKWRKYEEMPEGWNNRLLWDPRLLCPSCAERIGAAIDATIQEIRGDSENE